MGGYDAPQCRTQAVLHNHPSFLTAGTTLDDFFTHILHFHKEKENVTLKPTTNELVWDGESCYYLPFLPWRQHCDAE